MTTNRIALLTALLMLALAGIAAAQDSTHVKAVKAQTDSLRRETCRGGTLSASGLTCYGATAGPRVTVIRRLANRIDSLEKAGLQSQPPPPATNQKPVAAYTFTCASGTCILDGRTSTDDHGITEYKWRADSPNRPVKYGATTERYYGGSDQPWTEWLIVTDSAGLVDSVGKLITWTTPPPPTTTTDSAVSLLVLLSRYTIAVGETTLACGVFTTKTGEKGLLVPSQLVTAVDSVSTRVVNNPDGSTAPCLPLVQQAGITLTAGLTKTGAIWRSP